MGAMVLPVIGDRFGDLLRGPVEITDRRFEGFLAGRVEDFQEGMRFVNYEATARRDQPGHDLEAPRQVRHPAQHADGDQRQFVLAPAVRQGIDVRLDQLRRLPRGRCQLRTQLKKGTGLIEPQRRADPKRCQRQELARIVAADLDRRSTGQPELAQFPGQVVIEYRKPGFRCAGQQVLPVGTFAMQRGRGVPGGLVGLGEPVCLRVGHHCVPS